MFCISVALRLDSTQFEGVINRAGFRIQNHDDWDFFMSIMISECCHYEHVNVITVNEALIRKAMEPLLPDYAVRMLHDELFDTNAVDILSSILISAQNGGVQNFKVTI